MDRLAFSQIYVAACKGGNLLSAKSAQDLGLIQMVNTISSLPQTDTATGHNAMFSIPVPVKKNLPLSPDLPVESKHSDKMPTSADPKIQKIIENDVNVFLGQGKLAHYQVKLHINDKVQPVIQTHRRLPHHMREQVSAEL